MLNTGCTYNVHNNLYICKHIYLCVCVIIKPRNYLAHTWDDENEKGYVLNIEMAKRTMFFWSLFLPPPTTFSAIPRQNKMVLKFYPRNILAKHVWPPSPPHTTPLGRGNEGMRGGGGLHQWKCFPARKKGFGLHWWVGSMILYGICLNQTKGRILKPKSSNSSTNLILRKQKRQKLPSKKILQSAVFCPQIFFSKTLEGWGVLSS